MAIACFLFSHHELLSLVLLQALEIKRLEDENRALKNERIDENDERGDLDVQNARLTQVSFAFEQLQETFSLYFPAIRSVSSKT